ncbi:MAG: hypothetical protein HOQ22_15530 [Nocardioidaceae bacterium]|nr:hypothetical protein [Nocardioidaceae bacterium]
MSALDTLAFLVGSTTGPETRHPTPWTEGGAATGHLDGAWEAGGLAIAQRYREVGPAGEPLFAGLFVLMVDRDEETVLMWGFDSAGFPPEPARGGWVDGSLVLERTSPRGRSRATYTPLHGGGFTQLREFRASADDGWSPVVEGRYLPGSVT